LQAPELDSVVTHHRQGVAVAAQGYVVDVVGAVLAVGRADLDHAPHVPDPHRVEARRDHRAAVSGEDHGVDRLQVVPPELGVVAGDEVPDVGHVVAAAVGQHGAAAVEGHRVHRHAGLVGEQRFAVGFAGVGPPQGDRSAAGVAGGDA
jgi:hypothetical protein